VTWPPDDYRLPVHRRYNYPGLGRGDNTTLDKVLHTHHCQPDAWWFNVPVGPRPPWATAADFVDDLRQIDAHYRHRCDLICRYGTQLLLVELKPLMDFAAIGQAIVYRRMAYLNELCPAGCAAAVWTLTAPPEMHDAAALLGLGVRDVDHLTDRPPNLPLLQALTSVERSSACETSPPQLAQLQTPHLLAATNLPVKHVRRLVSIAQRLTGTHTPAPLPP
jgi:hypothetical protein